jgi:hypothetical protein
LSFWGHFVHFKYAEIWKEFPICIRFYFNSDSDKKLRFKALDSVAGQEYVENLVRGDMIYVPFQKQH